MCGHVGIAGRLEFKDEATIKRLLLYDYFRGPDSTGFASINKEGSSAKVAKIASHPLDLFDSGKFKASIQALQSSVFIGHNRAATRGVVNSVNAHPYEYGHIVGCHNGTLDVTSFEELKKKLGESFDVDSQAIFASIAKFGIKETVSMMRGAWALVWFDLEEKTLNFLRNKERPFWLAYTKDFGKILWASEWPMIQAALALSSQPYELYTEDPHGYKYFQTEIDLHIKFPLSTLLEVSKNIPEPLTEVMKGKEAPPITPPFHNYRSSSAFDHTSKVDNKKDTRSTNVVQLFGNDEDPFAGVITKKRFAEMTQYGCHWCSADVDYLDKGLTIIEDSGIVLCPDCSVDGGNRSRIYLTSLEKIA